MKTKDEIIYDFMLALAANAKFYAELTSDPGDVYRVAEELADEYLENSR